MVYQIQDEHIRETSRMRIYKYRREGMPLTPQMEQEQKRKITLDQELRTYEPEKFSGLVEASHDDAEAGEQVHHLWPDHKSIFFYDKERLAFYQNQEDEDQRGERKLDSIIGLMETKWARMDRYWFQKHRHLD